MVFLEWTTSEVKFIASLLLCSWRKLFAYPLAYSSTPIQQGPNGLVGFSVGYPKPNTLSRNQNKIKAGTMRVFLAEV